MRVLIVTAVGLLTVAGAVVVPASPAYAAACPRSDSGVTVVVDFTGIGGGTAVRCAPGDPDSGLAALTGAGFGYEFVPGQPGFVCRIDGLPDPCNGAPVDAYWSYWYAPAGGSWQYSSLGAGNRDPAPGTVEGWAFGAGRQPGVPPPAPPPPPDPKPKPKPPEPPPARPDPGRSEPDPGRDSDGSSGRDPGGSGQDPAVGGDSPAGPGGGTDRPARDRGADEDGARGSPTPATSGSPGPGGATPAGAEPAATPGVAIGASTDTSGGPIGVIVAVVLVAALALGGWWVARRRARPS